MAQDLMLRRIERCRKKWNRREKKLSKRREKRERVFYVFISRMTK